MNNSLCNLVVLQNEDCSAATTIRILNFAIVLSDKKGNNSSGYICTMRKLGKQFNLVGTYVVTEARQYINWLSKTDGNYYRLVNKLPCLHQHCDFNSKYMYSAIYKPVNLSCKCKRHYRGKPQLPWMPGIPGQWGKQVATVEIRSTFTIIRSISPRLHFSRQLHSYYWTLATNCFDIFVILINDQVGVERICFSWIVLWVWLFYTTTISLE